MSFYRFKSPNNLLIGLDRSNDRNYIKVRVPLVDRYGKSEEYYIFAKVGNTIQHEIMRVFSEDKRGRCIIKNSDIGEYIHKIIFMGREYENVQFYTGFENKKDGLAYVMVREEAYFLGLEEMLVSDKLTQIRIQDDTRFGVQDLPSYITKGGGACPTSEQKAIGLKLDIWNNATEKELRAYGNMAEMKASVISEMQFLDAYLKTTSEMNVFKNEFLLIPQTENVPGQKGVAAREIERTIEMMYSNLQARGSMDGEEEFVDYNTYSLVMRRFNRKKGPRYGLVYVGDCTAKKKSSEVEKYSASEKPNEKWFSIPIVVFRKKELGRKELKSDEFLNPSLPVTNRHTVVHKKEENIKQTQLEGEKKGDENAIVLTVSKVKKAKKKTQHEKITIPKKMKLSGGRARAQEVMLNMKKTGSKGFLGDDLLARRKSEPLTYGLRVRRSGQAELRARIKGLATLFNNLPKQDKKFSASKQNSHLFDKVVMRKLHGTNKKTILIESNKKRIGLAPKLHTKNIFEFSRNRVIQKNKPKFRICSFFARNQIVVNQVQSKMKEKSKKKKKTDRIILASTLFSRRPLQRRRAA